MKKFISVMLVAAMAVTALTGCGSNSGSSSKKDADKYYMKSMLQVVLTVSRLNTVLKMTRTMQRKQLMLTIH